MKHLIVFCLLLAGCSSFPYALETAERSHDAMENAGVELREAMDAVELARKEYVNALKNGDHTKVEDAITALQAAEDARRTRELHFEQTQKAFSMARDELERAKAADRYLEGVLGLLLGGLVGGGGGFLTGRKRKR